MSNWRESGATGGELEQLERSRWNWRGAEETRDEQVELKGSRIN